MATDPRNLKGSIAGPGGPRDRNAVVVDATHAVLLDSTAVCLVEPQRAGRRGHPCLAMTLGGRVNHLDETAEVLFLFDADGAAALVTELLALGARLPDAMRHEFEASIDRRLLALAEEDALGGGSRG